MRVEFVKSWRNYHKGQVLDLDDGFANVLLKRTVVRLAGPREPGPAGKKEKAHQSRSRGRETRDG